MSFGHTAQKQYRMNSRSLIKKIITNKVNIKLNKLWRPKNKSLYDTVLERYGQTTLKIVRDYEKDLSRFNKTSLNNGFLQKCKLFHIFRTLLNFKLSKEEFHDTRACRRFKEDLLNYELNQTFSQRCKFQKSYESARSILQTTLSPLDYNHICSKLKEFKFKFIHRTIVTKKELFRFGINTDDECL